MTDTPHPNSFRELHGTIRVPLLNASELDLLRDALRVAIMVAAMRTNRTLEADDDEPSDVEECFGNLRDPRWQTDHLRNPNLFTDLASLFYEIDETPRPPEDPT